MLVKILGVFDLIAAIILFLLSFNLGIPRSIMVFFIVVLFLKGAFVLTKSLASVFDLFAGGIMLLSFSFALPRIILVIAAILLLQKGFLSVVA